MPNKTIALIFPGQGAQYVGMGKDFYENSPEAKDIFERANKVLGYDITRIIFEGPDEKLKETIYTQPAVFTVSVAFFETIKKILSDEKILLKEVIAATAGHSLGEYTALYAAGVFPDFETALSIVSARAKFIQDCSVKYPGTMAAILGLDENTVMEICRASGAEAVNFNCPGQIVIAGEIEKVKKAMEIASVEKKALKVIQLNVSGAFHSSLMKEAAANMRQVLSDVNLIDAICPVFMNCDAIPTVNSSDIKNKLSIQIDHPVLWEKSARNMMAQGVTKFLEIGPGKVLAGLVKKIDRKIPVANLEKFDGLAQSVEFLKQ